MDDKLGDKILIREFNEERDSEEVMKLEKNCEIGSKEGISIFTNMMDDPLCRVKLYPVHVMLVAELLKNRKLVGMVRGCIKYVGTGSVGRHVNLGCILGLRVSPRHRRKGIGLKLVESIEEWLMRNGAQYTSLATEEKNVASTNLFSVKCNYVKLSSLRIYVQPVNSPPKDPPSHITLEKLSIDQAILFYNNHLRGKDMYPVDIDEILKENLSLGTWLSYYKEDDWDGLHDEDMINSRTPSSWVVTSIWNTSETYKLQVRKSHPFNFFHATLSHARDVIFPCLKMQVNYHSLQETFGFFFLYGLLGEGERLEELMNSLWSFASRLADQNKKDCKAIVTELADSDPLREHVPQGSSMSCINDLWYLKRANDQQASDEEEDNLMAMRPVGNVFVDPRDF
ncbi:probable N-acetyltransferase HLS1 [Cornus florida]|uniref:probable N-acetyltransferase HLS1 n=1 Tax=Cornus florida TaxID=4283 RepID=UPI00289E4C11|nr:probable N-acetyltransferase HLS1 [Cornus florida]